MRKAINLLIFSFLIVFVSCQSEPKSNSSVTIYESSDQLVEAAKKVITEISVEDFKTLYEGDEYFVLIDVRSVEEYDAGYIPGAVNISRGVLEFKIAKDEVWDDLGLYIPEKADKIILNCRSGGRSALATKALNELGYENVMSLQGGWNSWNETYPDLKEQITVEEESYIQEAPKTSHAAGGC